MESDAKVAALVGRVAALEARCRELEAKTALAPAVGEAFMPMETHFFPMGDMPGDDMPRPYEVRPYTNENDTTWWKIYLPTGSLLYWADKDTVPAQRYVNIFENSSLTNLGDGWYSLGMLGGDFARYEVWLRLYHSAGSREAMIASSPGGGDHDIHIATIYHATNTVRQSVVGALIITDPCKCHDGDSFSTGGSGNGRMFDL